MQLLRFHLMEDVGCESEIKQELEKKLDKMVMRDLYGKFKTAPTEEERERARRISEQARSAGEFSLVISSLMVRTGAWHAPV